MNNVTINIKKLDPKAKIPLRGSRDAAGYDLYAILPKPQIWIRQHATLMVNTGIAMEIPEGYFGAVFARSGLAAKNLVRPGNCVGVIDADYRNEIRVLLHNDSDEPQMIEDGQRIAQLVILPFLPVEFTEVDKLSTTVRGLGGFGSTGSK